MAHFLFPITIIGGWLIFSIYYIRKALKNYSSVNPYILESIPSVFPTLGILCTFIGITIGLYGFDTSDISKSMPRLLDGLKLAFFASMAGIVGLFVFQKIIAYILKKVEDDPGRPKRISDEVEALNVMNQKFDEFIKMFSTKSNNTDLKFTEYQRAQELSAKIQIEHQIGMLNTLNAVHKGIGSLSSQIASHAVEAKNGTERIIEAMSSNNVLLSRKFDEFSELLKKNNTEALVEVMKRSTEEFNAQMSSLINKLVQENFQELNNSVKLLNQWQMENKQQIALLTNQFKQVASGLQMSADSLDRVTGSTNELVKDAGKLDQLIQQLNKVLINDTRFTQITDNISVAVETLKNASSSFEHNTKKLNDWVIKEKEFRHGAEILIMKLEEFRDFNGGLWESYRKEMSHSVGIIKHASTSLKQEVEGLNESFYERLNDTFENLDELIQRVIKNYN